ncbi:MAG: cobalamin B12-binding domain-containing protein [Planctomycetaceae bacterium]|nr:cobalamin B12-binding domain-containing protein [Planctomycetaceae bacterium]
MDHSTLIKTPVLVDASPPIVAAASPANRRRRILIGKPGLDGHDRGAKYIVHLLRDHGYEVIYTGIRRTPDEIVAKAVRQQVDAIGLSVLSGAHMPLFTRVLELLATQRATQIVVFGGGIIPAEDVELLKSQGVAEIFTPGASADEILSALARLLPVTHAGA